MNDTAIPNNADPAPKRAKGELRFCVVVDVEEDFDWTKPFSKSNVNVASVEKLALAQAIFDRYGVVPSYMVTYPIATGPTGRRAIEALLSGGRCLIGAQLHPWVTPPFKEEISVRNSYPKNLDISLESEKIATLVEAIEASFGVRPLIYKAGRYGFDFGRSHLLTQQGFKVDTSVMPYSNFKGDGSGPDFFDAPEEPFWLNRDKELLAIPSTQGVVGRLSHALAPSAMRPLFGKLSNRLRVPALMSHLGLIERIRLSPEGSSIEDMQRLIAARVADGCRTFCVSFHSPSLVAGNTPYVRTEADQRLFLERLQGVLRFLVEEMQAKPSSTMDIHALYRAQLARDAEPSRPMQGAPASFTGVQTTPKKIMFISGFTPPRSPMAAVRTGFLINHWIRLGHDVRTIAIELPALAGKGSPLPHCYYLPYQEPGRILAYVNRGIGTVRSLLSHLGGRKTHDDPAVNGDMMPNEEANSSGWAGFKAILRQLVAFPDRYASWISGAVKLGVSWAPAWQPDLIYSSGPPHSGHIVASRLTRKLKVPWIAELRDLWAGNPYDGRHPLVEPLFDSVAKRTLSHAAACVGVTTMAVVRLQALTGRPVLLSYNGFDPTEFAEHEVVSPFDPERLTILHAGRIYPGRRDPSPLFEALRLIGDDNRLVRCLFCHDAQGEVVNLARKLGVEHCVEVHPEVSRREILKLERQVDILLECRCMDPAGDGVVHDRVFEYLGARRPVISIGALSGEAAGIVRDFGVGLASNDPSEIATMLRGALKQKRKFGRVPDVAGETSRQFEREIQFRKIDRLIDSIMSPVQK